MQKHTGDDAHGRLRYSFGDVAPSPPWDLSCSNGTNGVANDSL